MQAPIPRNAPCPCGSGRRFKECHGAPDIPIAAGTALQLLERALADAPGEPRQWKLALDTMIRERIGDADIGAGYSTGGACPLRVAVVTPYAREDLAVLRRCHDSVRGQTYPCRHFMIADGFARPELDAWAIEHLKLDRPHRDYGDTPRALGGEAAAEQGFDAVAYLDADNAFRPRHVESLVCRQQATGAPVCFSGRTLHLPDGSLVPGLMADDAVDHIDTSCILFGRGAFSMLSAWTRYPRQLAIVDDRMVRQMLLARGYLLCCTGALTVRYTVSEARFFRALGRAVPEDARANYDFGPLLDWYRSRAEGELAAVDETLGFSLRDFLRAYLATQGIAL